MTDIETPGPADGSGDLLIRVVRGPDATLIAPTIVTYEQLVVEKADPIVFASVKLIQAASEYVRGGVLTVGTPGMGLGVVSYRVGEVVPDPVPHHVLIRIDCP